MRNKNVSKLGRLNKSFLSIKNASPVSDMKWKVWKSTYTVALATHLKIPNFVIAWSSDHLIFCFFIAQLPDLKAQARTIWVLISVRILSGWTTNAVCLCHFAKPLLRLCAYAMCVHQPIRIIQHLMNSEKLPQWRVIHTRTREWHRTETGAYWISLDQVDVEMWMDTIE